MESKSRDPKYYVVGGPVHPDRTCYQQRFADAELLQRIADRDYCYLLAPAQSGKTSLVANVARALRANGTLVAIVDLIQASREDPAENSGRWYYSIVYRIVRELRIRVDVQTWWRDRSSLTNLQRLREFFLEIVLAETTGPVVVFFDRVDAAASEPLAQELFAAIRSCYDSRATDANLQRLTFVLIGSGTPAEIVRTVQGSLFEIAVPVQLDDFTAQEMGTLLAGLGEPLPEAEAILIRVYTWTRGHPYLSQKILRGLARRQDENLTPAHVDELVQNQFLAPNSLREELHLSALAERLTQTDPGRVALLNCYGRIRKGARLAFDSSSAAQRKLLSAGLVTPGESGILRVRNEIYARVFSPRWINQNLPYGSKKIGIVAAAIAVVLAAAIWYAEYLPKPYVSALEAANTDLEPAEVAYQKLGSFPGYGSAADRLYVNYLTSMAQTAATLPDMLRIASRLAALPHGTARSESLLGDFWERKAIAAINTGDRDGALLQLLEAMQKPTDSRRRLGGELVGQDYRNLRGVVHTRQRLRGIEADEQAGILTVLDAGNNVDSWQLDGDALQLLGRQTLVAEERLSVDDRRTVEALPGSARLIVKSDHPQPSQVIVLLRSPSGQEARLQLDAARVLRTGVYAFDFNATPSLRALLATASKGSWTIVLADIERGVSGDLLDWGLVGSGVADVVTNNVVAQPIPEPRAASNAKGLLGPRGRLGLSWPADQVTQGEVLVWDLPGASILARLPRSAEFIDARFVLGGERVMTLDERKINLWESASGKYIGAIDLDVVPEALTLAKNRRFLAIKTIQRNDMPAVLVWDLLKVRPVGRPVITQNIGPIAVDSAGKYLAIGGTDARMRVWSLQNAALVGEYSHGSPLRSVQFSPSGEWLVTDDLSSTFRLWAISKVGAPVLVRQGSGTWHADFSADSTRLLYGSAEQVYDVAHLPQLRSAGAGLQQGTRAVRSGLDSDVPAPIMLAEQAIAITNDAERSIRVWSVPAVDRSTGPPGIASASFTAAALSPDGERIALASNTGIVQLLLPDSAAATVLETTEESQQSAGNAGVVNLEFSSDRSLVAGASLDGRLRVWNSQNGEFRLLPVIHADGAAHDLVFIDGSRYLVSASRGEVIVTDLAAGSSVGRLRIQADHPQLAVAQLTSEVFIADDLGGVTSWNWQSDQANRLVKTDSRIRKIAVTADGKKMLTANEQGLLILWDIATRQALPQSVQAAGKVDDIRIVADDTRVVVQAGTWLQQLALSPTGLTVLHTRLLPFAPVAIQTDENGSTVHLLAAMASQPTVQQLRFDTPGVARLMGDPQVLRRYWLDRLGMWLDDQGQPQLTVDDAADSAAASAVEVGSGQEQ